MSRAASPTAFPSWKGVGDSSTSTRGRGSADFQGVRVTHTPKRVGSDLKESARAYPQGGQPPPENQTAAGANRGGEVGSDKPCKSKQVPSTPLRLHRQHLLAQREEVLDRLGVIETLSHWKLSLQARLAREKLIFLYSDADRDFGEFAREIEDFKRVSKLLTWVRGRHP
jgi:hypothetical protein